jgi:hypothetical protein
MRRLLVGEGVFHPLVVEAVGVVFAGMGAAGFLAVGSCDGGLGAINSGRRRLVFCVVLFCIVSGWILKGREL